ncbi:hypothetical protein L3476_26145 [Paenibacillus thiaminolyticus]|uniref:thiopeptide-type bacteriocin n=1 Tax=Paenibacillus TaxID=44249 RepID=UPI0013F5C026|nr:MULTISPECIES: thiopeptide-type bacteriocin [Paenibacillus]NGP58287.1 hypothetical protein [Paenibacillus thiaminolyticus]WCR26659.1 hypothetical protein L3476_26145 [Paenibacillus thiaminolyticus]
MEELKLENQEIELSLDDLELQDVKMEVLMTNSKGLPEMGATLGGITCCSCCCCST